MFLKLIIAAICLIHTVSLVQATNCTSFGVADCTATCGCIPCYINSTFIACSSSVSQCPTASRPVIPLKCDATSLSILVFNTVCLVAWHAPGVIYGLQRACKHKLELSSGQRRWFWTQVGFVLVICSMFGLPLSLSAHLSQLDMGLGNQSGISSLYEATLFMFALCMVLHDLVHIVEHEDSHAEQPSRLLNISFVVVHSVFAIITAFLTLMTLLTVTFNTSPADVQTSLDVLDGVISIMVAVVTLADYAYATINNLKHIGRHAPLRVRVIIGLVPALPTAAVVALIPLFFVLDGSQLVLHLCITLFAIGTTRTLRIMTRASKQIPHDHGAGDANDGTYGTQKDDLVDEETALKLIPVPQEVNKPKPKHPGLRFLTSAIVPRNRVTRAHTTSHTTGVHPPPAAHSHAHAHGHGHAALSHSPGKVHVSFMSSRVVPHARVERRSPAKPHNEVVTSINADEKEFTHTSSGSDSSGEIAAASAAAGADDGHDDVVVESKRSGSPRPPRRQSHVRFTSTNSDESS